MIKEKRLTSEDMYEYGYKDYSMCPLNRNDALKIWSSGCPVFKLYPDNTEAYVESVNEICDYDGMFGVERSDYKKHFTYLTNMYALIKFDRKINSDKHYISPGSYTLKGMNGDEVQFDFNNFEGCVEPYHMEYLSCLMKNLDCSSFSDSLTGITKDFINNIESVEDFYVYTGEYYEPEINPVEIVKLKLGFSDGEVISIPKEILQKYKFKTEVEND